MTADYDYWRKAVAGNFGPVHDGDPQPGFYRRRIKGGEDEAVAIWHDATQGMVAVSGGKAIDAAEIWTWVCNRPITEDDYRRVERGDGWPDSIESMIGSNNPPPDEAMADEVDSAITAALLALGAPCEVQADCDRLANHRDRLARLYKAREDQRKTEKQPHMDAAKAVDDRFKPVLAKIEDAGSKIKKAITAWLLKEEQKRREAAIAEMKRQEDVRQAAIAANEPPPALEPLPEVEKPKAGTSGRTTALRTYKSAVIKDYAKALSHFAENAEVKELIQQLADRCARANIEIPGCEIKEEKRAA